MQRLSVGLHVNNPSYLNPGINKPVKDADAKGNADGLDHDERTRRIAALFESARQRKIN